MKNRLAEEPLITEWEAETLRLTAFPTPSWKIGEVGWWASLVGHDPDTVISKVRQGQRIEEGSYDGGKLTLAILPARLDWLMTSVGADGEVEAGAPYLIGPFSKTLNKFLELMFKWFEFDNCPSVTRLAFGAILNYPVSNREEGYRHLTRYLRTIQIDPKNSSDLLYQINRPIESRVSRGLRVNRLSKWSVLTWGSAQIDISREGIASAFTPSNFAARLELDINTVPDPKWEFGRETLRAVFQELVDLGDEIARRGDTP